MLIINQGVKIDNTKNGCFLKIMLQLISGDMSYIIRVIIADAITHRITDKESVQ